VTEVRAEEGLEEPAGDERPDRAPPERLGIAALARDTAIYGGTRVLIKSLTFLLVPLYAHYLTPREFGVLEIVLAIVALVDVVISANLDGVLARFYFDRDEPGWRRQVITLYFLISALYPAVIIGVLVAVSGTLTDRLVGAGTAATLLVIAFCDLYLTNIVDLPLLLARLRRKPFTFAVYSLSRGVVQVALAVVFVAGLELGVKGVLLASLVSVAVAFVVTVREYARDLTRAVAPSVGREMVSFAWPGVLGGVSFYAINLLDRFFVKHYHGLEDTGLYGAAFRYAQIVLVAVLAFRLGWPQWHYSWLHSGRHPEMVARGGNYYFFAVCLLAVAVSAWILPLFHAVMPERYWDATSAVAPLALAAVATGAYSLFAVGLMVEKRMRLLPVLVFGGGVISILLNFALVPPFSFEGAAWSKAVAFSALAVGVALVGHRIYPVPWAVRRIGLAFGLAVLLALASLAVDAWLPFAASLPVRLAIVAAYPVALVSLGFFPPSDLAAARQALRRASGRSRGDSS
jgi:O-antigen/teichoic acid export membrane protein